MPAATVTVFGGTGFLGRRIVATLLEAGREVRVATRNPETVDAAAWASRVKSIAADVRDPEAVARAVQSADAIVNAVSLYVEGQGLDFESVHVDGARNIAQAAEGRPLVHVSGIGAHESSPSAYVRARARGERAVRDACSNAIILRPSVLFGPNDAFLRTLDAITRLPLIPLFGRGDTKLQPVHVDDLAMAVLHAMDNPTAAGRILELGGAGTYRYREILALVLAARGRKRWLVPVPFVLWHLLAAIATCLPSPPLTRDQVILMRDDNVVGPDAMGFEALGIAPRNVSAALTECLG
ncbi:complex I NDUFA9 subunit family protein [Algiphilus sp.]|uniref:complex I NDUFA9 subunit family protein n=1 Tax=Algiphilus sp. TaxID=1872431 RepID=UPI0032EB9621